MVLLRPRPSKRNTHQKSRPQQQRWQKTAAAVAAIIYYHPVSGSVLTALWAWSPFILMTILRTRTSMTPFYRLGKWGPGIKRLAQYHKASKWLSRVSPWSASRTNSLSPGANQASPGLLGLLFPRPGSSLQASISLFEKNPSSRIYILVLWWKR